MHARAEVKATDMTDTVCELHDRMHRILHDGLWCAAEFGALERPWGWAKEMFDM